MVELSVILTAHDEGILAHKTMLSIFRALEGIKSYEIIVHIDKGSKDTIAYFERYANDKRFTIIRNNFGDSGKSRNAAVKVARGKYVLFRDADDLVSSNYIAETLKILRRCKANDTVVSSQYCLNFWDCTGQSILQKMPNSTTREENAKLLFGVNPWMSSLAGAREIFLKYPYSESHNSFSDEYYAMNVRLIEHGIKFRYAPNTVLFHRRKAESWLTRNVYRYMSLPYSTLFDYKEWQKYTEPKATPAESELAKSSLWKNLYRTVRHDSKVLNGLIQPIANGLKKLTGKKLIEDVKPIDDTEIPSAVLAAWKEQNAIEIQLWPTPFAKYRFVEYDLDADPACHISHEYWKICQQITHTPDYIFIIPWIVTGGADKVLLNYIAALRKVHPSWKITVIVTETEENVWKDYLPDDVDFIDFGEIAKELDQSCQDWLLTRLLVQLQCKKLHIINSLPGYEWVKNHPELVKAQFEVYVSLFADVQMEDCAGAWWGYSDPYLTRIYPLVKKVFTDSQNFANRLIKVNGFDPKRLVAIYQPVDATEVKHKTKSTNTDGKIHILWASRITASKNPELLVRIAQKLNPEKYHLDVWGCVSPDREGFKFPDDVPALNYHGEYNGFNSLPLDEYDIFLYTSFSDGMPNAILEAGAAGLPIIASDVGGVSNFVQHNKTGFLVEDVDNEDKYIELLETVRQNPKKPQKVASQATKLLESQHSWQKFCDVIKHEF